MRIKPKVSKVMPKKVGINRPRRRRMKVNIVSILPMLGVPASLSLPRSPDIFPGTLHGPKLAAMKTAA
jgi:hypothetical protein